MGELAASSEEVDLLGGVQALAFLALFELLVELLDALRVFD